MKFILYFITLITSVSYGQTIHSSIPKNVNKSEKYLFYLHGRIIEEQGADNAIHHQFGKYEYWAILDTLKNHGFTVMNEIRSRNTDEKQYAKKISRQIDTLLLAGVPPENIFVVGASKGAFITLWVSVYLGNNKINFAVMGTCSDQTSTLIDPSMNNLCGNFLSIYETSDTYASSCEHFIVNQKKCITGFKEVALKMNNGHGFLYKPYKEWIDPLIIWAYRK